MTETSLPHHNKRRRRTINSDHHISQTLFGPICKHPKCQRKVSNKLFSISERLIRLHWQKNSCYNGQRIPNAALLKRKLMSELSSMLQSAANCVDPPASILDTHLPPESTIQSMGTFCSQCGFCAPRHKVHRHMKAKNSSCVSASCNTGLIYETAHGFKVPKLIFDSVLNGNFKLPEANSSIANSGKSKCFVHMLTSLRLLVNEKVEAGFDFISSHCSNNQWLCCSFSLLMCSQSFFSFPSM